MAEGRRFDSETDTEVVAQLLDLASRAPGCRPSEAIGQGAGAPARRLRAGVLFGGQPRSPDRRPPRQPAGCRLRRRRDVHRLRRAGAGAADQRDRLSRGGRLGGARRRGRHDLRGPTRKCSARSARRHLGRLIGKGNYRHFMEKEIYEQPAVIGDTLRALPRSRRRARSPCRRCRSTSPRRRGSRSSPAAPPAMPAWSPSTGSRSWRACRSRSTSPPSSATASRRCPRAASCIVISQSGETADTLAALRYAKAQQADHPGGGQRAGERIAREADACCPLWPGRRSASPRPRPSPRSSPCCWRRRSPPAARAARCRADEEARLANALIELPARVTEVLNQEEQYRRIAEESSPRRATCSISAAASSFPIALEGALKLKEITYIHAEGYAAGEMKHGPIALIDEAVPVIVVAPPDAAVRQDRLQLRGGDGARRQAGAAERPGGQCAGWAATRRRRSACPRSIRSWRRSSTPCRCSCWPTTRRCQGHRRRPAAQPRQERDGGVILEHRPTRMESVARDVGNSVAIVPSRFIGDEHHLF